MCLQKHICAHINTYRRTVHEYRRSQLHTDVHDTPFVTQYLDLQMNPFVPDAIWSRFHNTERIWFVSVTVHRKMNEFWLCCQIIFELLCLYCRDGHESVNIINVSYMVKYVISPFMAIFSSTTSTVHFCVPEIPTIFESAQSSRKTGLIWRSKCV